MQPSLHDNQTFREPKHCDIQNKPGKIERGETNWLRTVNQQTQQKEKLKEMNNLN